MRKFAETWTNPSIVQQPVAQLQWRSILTIMAKIKVKCVIQSYQKKTVSHIVMVKGVSMLVSNYFIKKWNPI